MDTITKVSLILQAAARGLQDQKTYLEFTFTCGNWAEFTNDATSPQVIFYSEGDSVLGLREGLACEVFAKQGPPMQHLFSIEDIAEVKMVTPN